MTALLREHRITELPRLGATHNQAKQILQGPSPVKAYFISHEITFL